MSLRSVAFAVAVSLAAAVVPGGSAVAGNQAEDGKGDAIVYPLHPSTHRNPEGIAWHEPSQSFFVGAVGDGTIYRGQLNRKRVRPWLTVDRGAGRSAVGMEAANGKLYVAGGSTGKLFVYSLRTRKLIGEFDTGTGGFLNDLVVTPRGHVFITDSFRPFLWHVTRAHVEAGTGVPRRTGLAPDISYVGDEFNLNGIEFAGSRTFVAVQSVTGLLYEIRLDNDLPFDRAIQQVNAPAVVGGDGLTWDRGRLIVVTGDPAQLVFMGLREDLSEGVITHERTDPALRGPATVARAGDRYLVVNADFATSATPFTVVSLAAPDRHPPAELPDEGDGWMNILLRARH